MTISLVTGGSGYFGSLLVRRLQVAGHTVRVLDIHDSSDRADSVEFIKADIRNDNDVQAAVQGVDIVFHNVAQVPLAKDKNLLRTVNIDGTRILLNACQSSSVSKVVHTSSSAIFGVPATNPVLPSTLPHPMEIYGEAKWQAELLCHEAIANGLDVTIIRPRTILGHGRLGIFGILFDWIADGADPFVLGSGNNRYQFVHAEDLADVCLLAGTQSDPAVFNVGTDRFGTMREALHNLCEEAKTGSKVRSLPSAPTSAAMRAMAAFGLAPFAPYHWIMYSKSMWFDIDHVQSALAWSPKWSNDEMFKQTYEWFLANRAATNASASSQHRRSAKQGLLAVLKKSTQLLPR